MLNAGLLVIRVVTTGSPPNGLRCGAKVTVREDLVMRPKAPGSGRCAGQSPANLIVTDFFSNFVMKQGNQRGTQPNFHKCASADHDTTAGSGGEAL